MGKIYNFKTDVVKANLNPKWRNCCFTIVSNEPTTDMIDLTLFDWDRNSSDDELARLSIPVSKVIKGDVDEWMDMQVTHQKSGFKLSSFLSKYDRSRPTKIQIKMSRIGVHNTTYDPNATNGPSIPYQPPIQTQPYNSYSGPQMQQTNFAPQYIPQSHGLQPPQSSGFQQYNTQQPQSGGFQQYNTQQPQSGGFQPQYGYNSQQLQSGGFQNQYGLQPPQSNGHQQCYTHPTQSGGFQPQYGYSSYQPPENPYQYSSQDSYQEQQQQEQPKEKKEKEAEENCLAGYKMLDRGQGRYGQGSKTKTEGCISIQLSRFLSRTTAAGAAKREEGKRSGGKLFGWLQDA
eukprot:TRINITY_DN436_c0_g1_i4.p1 TRINITY_DN436_c0_g1~~TRINITY_DN436_c0_g1_i4.p1  ORF type:complete len:344 (-),score=60.09 TRINITY_DN436_c0_g1_i4:75-1106(-)